LEYLNSSNNAKKQLLNKDTGGHEQKNDNLFTNIFEETGEQFASIQDSNVLDELIKQFINKNNSEAKISELEINNIVNYFNRNMDYFVLNNRLNNLKQLFEVF